MGVDAYMEMGTYIVYFWDTMVIAHAITCVHTCRFCCDQKLPWPD